MSVANKLRRFRFEAREMTQQELAEKIGVTRQTILAIERGNYNPSVELALRLAKVFKCSVEELFAIDDSKESKR